MTQYDWGTPTAHTTQSNSLTLTNPTPSFASASDKLALLNQLESTPQTHGFRPIHIVYGLCAVGVLGSLAFGGIQNIMMQRSATAHIRQQRVSMQVQEQEFALRQEQAKVQDAIAQQRYANGCVFLISPLDQNSFVSINQGGAVVDGITGQPIAPSTTICDPNGGTAIVSDEGTATSYAFTGNAASVDEAAIASGYTIHRQSDFGHSKQATQ